MSSSEPGHSGGRPRSVVSRCAWSYAALTLAVLSGCSSRAPEPGEVAGEGPRPTLSAYGLFTGPLRDHTPAAGVIPYDLNTPLFSDYTSKYRFIKLPEGTSARYVPGDTAAADVEFPVGTVIAKTFAMPRDMGNPDAGERLLETRILEHTPDGWGGWAYVWNDDETEADLKIAGAFLDVEWIHGDGTPRTNKYLVPNANQCKGCHKAHDKVMAPIGPKVRNLDRDYEYAHGSENQLAYWRRIGALEGLDDERAVERLPVWNDPNDGTLDERARAWLETNCAHCHNPAGPAANSGLDLRVVQHAPYDYGVYRSPVAAGRGTGGRMYDIVPGKPDESILLHRIAATDPAVMMPELGKRLVHEEGVELIRAWIAAMPDPQAGAGGG